jgi:RHS repeat-associated protein
VEVRAKLQVNYTAYGLKIAAISSKAFDAPNNPYQYQGDYSEFDDETGWNDFELRSYDPQIGRFIQADPYDQFPSPYTGMGNDPINNVDPSGGFSFGPFASGFMNHAFWTVGGAVIGGAIDAANGGNGWNGVAIGAGVGLGASFVNWGSVAGAIGDAGKWTGQQIGGLFSGGGSEWLELTKSALTQLANQYSNRIFTSEGAKQNYLGNMFEDNWHVWAQMHFTQNAYHSNGEPDELDDGQGSTIPNHSSRQRVIVDAKMTEYNLSNRGIQPYVDAHWFEVKATSSNISKSTSNYQIQYEMDALASSQRAAVKAGVASYSIVTTANAAIGNSVYEYGNTKGLFVRHFKPQYKVTSTGVQVRFGWEQSTRIKGVPIRMLTKYTYGLPVNMSF